MFSLLAYAVIKFRRRAGDDGREPPQIYGSNQVELAWTVIPVLIVVVLFLATARVIHAVEDARFPAGTIEVTAVGHQFWWEFQYPQDRDSLLPMSCTCRSAILQHPTPTHITLLSADTDHSFWVPKLAGKTDLIPNRANNMWIDPHETGVYVGQCAQYCGTQHAKMLLRVIVQSRAGLRALGGGQQKQPAVGHRCQGPASLRVDGMRQLPHRCRNQCPREVWSRPDAPDEPRDDRGRGGAQYTATTCGSGSRIRTTFKPGCTDAGHATERSGPGRSDRLSNDVAVEGPRNG